MATRGDARSSKPLSLAGTSEDCISKVQAITDMAGGRIAEHDVLPFPAPGQTNQQLWAGYGLAVAGSVARCNTTRSLIAGFACPMTAGEISALPGKLDAGANGVPSAPSSFRLVPLFPG